MATSIEYLFSIMVFPVSPVPVLGNVGNRIPGTDRAEAFCAGRVRGLPSLVKVSRVVRGGVVIPWDIGYLGKKVRKCIAVLAADEAMQVTDSPVFGQDDHSIAPVATGRILGVGVELLHHFSSKVLWMMGMVRHAQAHARASLVPKEGGPGMSLRCVGSGPADNPDRSGRNGGECLFDGGI